MSGVITGPHFRKFFNNPGAIQVGTMVAVLEIGAFSKPACRLPDVNSSPVCSHFPRSWSGGRSAWSPRNALRRRNHLRCWRGRSNLHSWILGDGRGTCHCRVRGWLAIVRLPPMASGVQFVSNSNCRVLERLSLYTRVKYHHQIMYVVCNC